MKHDHEEPEIFNTTITKDGERVKLRRRWCKCGHTVNFVSRIPRICNFCGHIVYPDDRYEFMEKMKKELKK